MPGQPDIVVIGSLNVDHFVRVDRFPAPGETVEGRDLEQRFGGKGANQAVAAAGLGARVAMIGAVGDDGAGRQYLDRLEAFGIDGSGVSTQIGGATGCAFISVDVRGENTIVVAPGANAAVDDVQVRAHAGMIASAGVLLIQNEVPHVANVAAAQIASKNGTEIVYNPAPWDARRAVAELGVDLLIVNEGEAAGIDDLERFPKWVVTRGKESTRAGGKGQRFEVAVERLDVVDTVGAGDAFAAAIAVSLSERCPFPEAIARANRVAGEATLHRGAQREPRP